MQQPLAKGRFLKLFQNEYHNINAIVDVGYGWGVGELAFYVPKDEKN